MKHHNTKKEAQKTIIDNHCIHSHVPIFISDHYAAVHKVPHGGWYSISKLPGKLNYL